MLICASQTFTQVFSLSFPDYTPSYAALMAHQKWKVGKSNQESHWI